MYETKMPTTISKLKQNVPEFTRVYQPLPEFTKDTNFIKYYHWILRKKK